MIIYKATNLVNGKIYIGKTKKSLEARKKEHLKTSKYSNRSPIFLTGENPPQDISSTQVRTILKKLKRYPAVMPKSLNGYLDPAIYKYIKMNNLYR